MTEITLNRDDILVGAPDQGTTGAIFSAPLGTKLPGMPSEELDPAFVGSGYVDEEGVTITPEKSEEGIKDWNLDEVRKMLTEFKNSVAWAHLSTSKESLTNYFGEGNVTVTAATDTHGNIIKATLNAKERSIGSAICSCGACPPTHGNIIKATLNAKEHPRKAWVWRMKDGEHRVLIVAPEAQIGEVGELGLKKSSPMTWPVTLTTFPDAEGNHLYFYFDDGQVLVAKGTSTTTDPAGATPTGEEAAA